MRNPELAKQIAARRAKTDLKYNNYSQYEIEHRRRKRRTKSEATGKISNHFNQSGFYMFAAVCILFCFIASILVKNYVHAVFGFMIAFGGISFVFSFFPLPMHMREREDQLNRERRDAL